MSHWNVAILIFQDVEVLDFCGPFEVFAAASHVNESKPFTVFTVAEERRVISARHGFLVQPHYTLQDCPRPDILIVPGGWGTRALVKNEAVVRWVEQCAGQAQIVFSVCTGAIVLGKAGLLRGLRATTHHASFALLREYAPESEICPDCRYTDNGKILTSGGISAGIDLSFHVVARLLGSDSAAATARYMEYRWTPEDQGVTWS